MRGPIERRTRGHSSRPDVRGPKNKAPYLFTAPGETVCVRGFGMSLYILMSRIGGHRRLQLGKHGRSVWPEEAPCSPFTWCRNYGRRAWIGHRNADALKVDFTCSPQKRTSCGCSPPSWRSLFFSLLSFLFFEPHFKPLLKPDYK